MLILIKKKGGKRDGEYAEKLFSRVEGQRGVSRAQRRQNTGTIIK
jgi:hypothetical protein